MLHSIITTIQKPTASVLGLVEKLNEVGGKLIVAGDKKGPASYEVPSSEWRSSFALRGSGVTVVTGGVSKEESRVEGRSEWCVAVLLCASRLRRDDGNWWRVRSFNIPNPFSPNAWPVAAFLDTDCNRKKTV
jgi:hypothetical protein